MPFIGVTINQDASQETIKQFLQQLSKTSSELMNKPEERFMLSFNKDTLSFAGTDEPSIFVRYNSIGGLDKQINPKLSANIADLAEQYFGVNRSRIYVSFKDVEPHNWGLKGGIKQV